MRVSEKTLHELEFGFVREQIANLCHFEMAKHEASHLTPIQDTPRHKAELQCTHELHQCMQLHGLPPFRVDEIAPGLKQLAVPDLQVSLEHFVVFLDTAYAFQAVQNLLKPKKDLFPGLFSRFHSITFQKEIVKHITRVFDTDGSIKNNASPALKDIRQMLASKNQEFQRLFQTALSKALQAGHLAETRESILGGRRVLSVLSERKRQVRGRFMGISKSGKITYIEPEETIECSNDLVYLENQEQNEIARILQQLSNDLRPFREDLEHYHYLLSWLDFTRAKVDFGASYKGITPLVDYNKRGFTLHRAFHPVLLCKAEKQSDIVPQDLNLDAKQRFLVISGPNAGGKSISLKTVGLLQTMVQCALLVPVAEGSKFGWFKQLFSDIGDNQSIENELSTYSYRLKQMRFFLEHANEDSLILIDEFGSGSDPELGGALAEVCLEELYNRKGFGVFTTHYGNIKVLVDQLDEAVNGSMLFDHENLDPTYKLSVGNAGSSFTFEVAQKMGLSKKILQKARKKTNKKKVSLDQSLANAQQYENQLRSLRTSLTAAKKEHEEAQEALDKRSAYYEKQFSQLQEVQQRNDKYITLGRKFWAFITSFPEPEYQDSWFAEIKRYALKEQAKIEVAERKKKPKKQAGSKKAAPKQKAAKTKEEASDTNQLLQRAQQAAPKTKPKKKEKPLVIGATVSVLGSSTKGKVIAIEKKQAIVEMAGFTSKIALDKIQVH